MPASALDKVESVPGVAAAQGNVSSDGNLLDPKGEPIVSNGPPTLILSSAREALRPADLPRGRPAEEPGEVVLDRATADKYGWKPGAP